MTAHICTWSISHPYCTLTYCAYTTTDYIHKGTHTSIHTTTHLAHTYLHNMYMYICLGKSTVSVYIRYARTHAHTHTHTHTHWTLPLMMLVLLYRSPLVTASLLILFSALASSSNALDTDDVRRLRISPSEKV